MNHDLQPDFASDEDDLFTKGAPSTSSVVPIKNQPEETDSETPKSVSSNENSTNKSRAKKKAHPKPPRWLTNKYTISLVGLMTLLTATVTYVGPNKFVQQLDAITLPSLSDGDIQDEMWQQKISELSTQFEASQEKVAEIQSNLGRNASYQEQISELRTNQRELISRMEGIHQNLNATLSKLDSLESDMLTFATTDRDFGNLLSQVQSANSAVQKLTSQTERNTKNFGWLANRTEALEDWKESNMEPNRIVSEQSSSQSKELVQSRIVKGSPVKRVVQWEIKLASFERSIAFLKNKSSNQKLRVTIGTNVPNCGKVSSMNAVDRTITAGTCVIRS